ncbi:MAG: hypothetical protein M0Z66_15905 [Thermaerobacter sp.]|nr:hypothetical protein [Thermaerobacter sp.]
MVSGFAPQNARSDLQHRDGPDAEDQQVLARVLERKGGHVDPREKDATSA